MLLAADEIVQHIPTTTVECQATLCNQWSYHRWSAGGGWHQRIELHFTFKRESQIHDRSHTAHYSRQLANPDLL